ncbi:Mu transposase C-terminal domain-containing protein [Nonomuraea wenchangensis]|uniref:Mu transposase, C-terminal n=1 Tax=Nonomuraea wenchangensis TaxID=568860 RepID=A0A1I0LJY5_9ACTN|nr:Mu transposase C-terminal domain-containing protein [Nonomuraea wenchangensis]SEU40613.1 Mu transposase, C-terminal [Nonomuraea wenchangensis]
MNGPGAGVEPSPPLAQLTVTAREEAVRRFGILQPHLEDAIALSEVAHTGKISIRTARRWAARYRRGGLTAFGRRYLDPTLAAFVGEGVVIRYDPRDLAERTTLVDQLLAHRTGLPATARELAPPAPARRRLKIYTEE